MEWWRNQSCSCSTHLHDKLWTLGSNLDACFWDSPVHKQRQKDNTNQSFLLLFTSAYFFVPLHHHEVLFYSFRMPGWLKHTGAFPSCDILPLTITNFRSHLWLLPFITNFFASGSFLQLWEQFAPPLSCFACGSDTSSRTSREKTGEDVFWKKQGTS